MWFTQLGIYCPLLHTMHPQVLIHPATLTLHPGEVLHETLTLVPSAPGWLRVTGVTWVTDGVVPGRAVFDIRGRHRKKPKGDRWVVPDMQLGFAGPRVRTSPAT